MDGTLCDYAGALWTGLDALWSPDEPRIFPVSGVRHPDYIHRRILLIRNQPGWWRNLKPLDLGFAILDLVRELGFRTSILTQGPKSSPNAYTEKFQWVRDNIKDPNVGVTITQDKGSYYGKVLVDDHPPYLEAWLKHRPRGLAVIPDQPWNQGWEHPQAVRATLTNLDQVRHRLVEVRATHGS